MKDKINEEIKNGKTMKKKDSAPIIELCRLIDKLEVVEYTGGFRYKIARRSSSIFKLKERR